MVEALHLGARKERGIFQEGVQEFDRIGAPENLAVDCEARHAEDAFGGGFVGVLSQGVFYFGAGELFGLDVQLIQERCEASGIGGVGARGPEIVENSRYGLGPRARGDAQPEMLQRIEWMQGGETERDPELTRPPLAPSIGPAPLRGDFGGALLAMVGEQGGEEDRLVNEWRFPPPFLERVDAEEAELLEENRRPAEP